MLMTCQLTVRQFPTISVNNGKKISIARFLNRIRNRVITLQKIGAEIADNI